MGGLQNGVAEGTSVSEVEEVLQCIGDTEDQGEPTMVQIFPDKSYSPCKNP